MAAKKVFIDKNGKRMSYNRKEHKAVPKSRDEVVCDTAAADSVVGLWLKEGRKPCKRKPDSVFIPTKEQIEQDCKKIEAEREAKQPVATKLEIAKEVGQIEKDLRTNRKGGRGRLPISVTINEHLLKRMKTAAGKNLSAWVEKACEYYLAEFCL